MSITLEVNELEEPKYYTYYLKIRVFMEHPETKEYDNGNHELEPFLQYLEEKKYTIQKYTWTTKNGERSQSKKDARLHWHCHVIVVTTIPFFGKTPIQQLFKTWLKSKGITYEKKQMSFILDKKLEQDEDWFLQYPLKCQKALTEEMYYGISTTHAEKLLNFSQAILKQKLNYQKQKVLKEENTKNTWSKLVIFVKDKCENDPRWKDLISIEEEYSGQINVWEPLGIIKNIRTALNILLPYIVDYYMNYEDCNIPYNIDKLAIRYLAINKLVTSFQISQLLSKY